ncbi:MAG TPA: nuclear transport factor 2 family protein [Terracidiphilus sp.]
MQNPSEQQIALVEDRLRTAMLRSDVAALDELLAPDMLFANHLGQLPGKNDDLAAHRSGAIQIASLDCSEQRIMLIGGVAVVSVRVQVAGKYNETPTSGDFALPAFGPNLLTASCRSSPLVRVSSPWLGTE